MKAKKMAKSRLKAYKNKKKFERFVCWMFWIVLMLWLAVACSFQGSNKINSVVRAYEYKKPIVIDSAETNISVLIEDAVDEFLPNHKSESLMIMHCLAHRESGHGASNAHGDGGLAGGPYQFHEATWQRMRKQMINQGLADEIGSRYDLKEAIRTTAWAINEGRAKEWGPILRDSKGSDFAACQTPSWY